MEAAAFFVFEKGFWWLASIRKRGLEGTVADKMAFFAFKLDKLALKATEISGVLA
jgi:hypothetical protein